MLGPLLPCEVEERSRQWERIKRSLRRDAARFSTILRFNVEDEKCPEFESNALCQQQSLAPWPISSPLTAPTPDISPRTLGDPNPTLSALRHTKSVPELRRLTKLEIGDISNPIDLTKQITPKQIVPGARASLIYDGGNKRVYKLNDYYVLTLTKPELDIDKVVRNQRLAASVIPAPWVYSHGRRLDYTYMVTDYVPGRPLQRYVDKNADLDLSIFLPQIETIVDRLASVNLAHGDLYPRNVMVDKNLNVVGIIDWDTCDTLENSYEYQRRATSVFNEHDWDSAFRPFHSPAVLFHGYEFPHFDFGFATPPLCPVNPA
ncbi:hypothetical protein CALVIDRAFT_96859 [Calocera viscosa TUFC12733]|uniref:Protein kinase domain-containing protein n=1 Tax=Calocera viscosa (strain TUFC12733) TaxID=1330018 RepID=A0A167MZ85_CALVF|nr:hypothetical protein CALVIDRAFT_96859 [Calocera viscosa TUFC12733]